MTNNCDIKIVSEFIPANPDIALLDSSSIRGGIHTVNTSKEINLLSDDLKKPGMIFYVEEENEYHRLLPDGRLEPFVDSGGFLGKDEIIAGDNIIVDTSDGKVTIGAVIGDIPDNQVFSEEVIDVQSELPVVTITTTGNPHLMVNKQDKVDPDLSTDSKTIVGAINEVKEGMQKAERDAIAAVIGSPANGDNTPFELANHITNCNITLAPSLRSAGAILPGNNPTYYQIVNAAKAAFGAGTIDQEEAQQGAYVNMYYRLIDETTGDYAWYRINGYTATEAKQVAIEKGAYNILLPRTFDNVIVEGSMYTGDNKYVTYDKKGTYDNYYKAFYIVSIKDIYNGSATDISDRFSFRILLNQVQSTLGQSYTKLNTLSSSTGNYARYIYQDGKTYFQYEMNGSASEADDDKQYWDSYCKCIYAWDNV